MPYVFSEKFSLPHGCNGQIPLTADSAVTGIRCRWNPLGTEMWISVSERSRCAKSYAVQCEPKVGTDVEFRRGRIPVPLNDAMQHGTDVEFR